MKWLKNKALIFLFIIGIIFSASLFLTTNIFAKQKTTEGCLYIGGPNYECPHASLESCFCEPVVITP